jgi:hypothetical protein
MQTKNMNIQKPVWEVPGKRNAAPSAIAAMKEQVRKRHCSGSRHQSIENRRHEGRLSAAPLVWRREYQTVPSENSIVVTNTSVQKTTSGFVWLSRSGSISEYPVHTERTINTTFRAVHMRHIDLTRKS